MPASAARSGAGGAASPPAGADSGVGGLLAKAPGRSTANRSISCSFPLSKRRKDSLVRPSTTRPCLSRTTTGTITRLTCDVNVAFSSRVLISGWFCGVAEASGVCPAQAAAARHAAIARRTKHTRGLAFSDIAVSLRIAPSHVAPAVFAAGALRLRVERFDRLSAKILGHLHLHVIAKRVERLNDLLERESRVVLRPVNLDHQRRQFVQFDAGLL